MRGWVNIVGYIAWRCLSFEVPPPFLQTWLAYRWRRRRKLRIFWPGEIISTKQYLCNYSDSGNSDRVAAAKICPCHQAPWGPSLPCPSNPIIVRFCRPNFYPRLCSFHRVRWTVYMTGLNIHSSTRKPCRFSKGFASLGMVQRPISMNIQYYAINIMNVPLMSWIQADLG